MERRLVVFLVTATVVMMGWMFLSRKLFPPPPPVAKEDGQKDKEGQKDDAGADEKPDGEDGPGEDPEDGGDDTPDQPGDEPETPDDDPPAEDEPAKPEFQRQWVTLGSADPAAPYRMLVTFVNTGAAIERIELSSSQFRDLEDRGGYIGHLALTTRQDEPGLLINGLLINVVGPGTPAALAQCHKVDSPSELKPEDVPQGLKPGDVLLHAGGEDLASTDDLKKVLASRRPGEKLLARILRGAGEEEQVLQFSLLLGNRPLEVVRPEMPEIRDSKGRVKATKKKIPLEPHPLSYLLTLEQVKVKGRGSSIAREKSEIANLPSLYESNWEVVQDPERPDEVEFHFELTDAMLQEIGASGGLKIVKRFRLRPIPAEEQENESFRAYHLDYEIEFQNLGDDEQEIAYRQQGPTGMPREGWWYTNKVHPSRWSAVGTRDIVFSLEGERRLELEGCPQIVKHKKKNPDDPNTKLYLKDRAAPLRFIGGDTQYFSTVLIPQRDDDNDGGAYEYPRALAFAVADIDSLNLKRTNVTYQVSSEPFSIPPHETTLRKFTLFAGPKAPDVLAKYTFRADEESPESKQDLRSTIVYGWFGWVSKPMISLLHLFYTITGGVSYGLAILMLTVLVRACMFPLSRKQVLSAQKMQELAPELKKIAERYKDDMQKRAAAQQELFRKHKYNPLGGCVLVFFQLPIFIGLYRGLSVDIALRQAPLIPGVQWCANLAAPDQLWNWQHVMPTFLAGPNGFLGPYLNILPLLTIALFIVQQKLFTPPASDDSQKTQQRVMMFMMLFIGFLFFRVPAGLCLYFIASSLWSVGERKLLPKVKKAEDKPIDVKKAKAEAEAKKKAKRKKTRRR